MRSTTISHFVQRYRGRGGRRLANQGVRSTNSLVIRAALRRASAAALRMVAIAGGLVLGVFELLHSPTFHTWLSAPSTLYATIVLLAIFLLVWICGDRQPDMPPAVME